MGVAQLTSHSCPLLYYTWSRCQSKFQKYCSCHFHEWIKLWLCHQFPQAGPKWPLAISWNSQESDFWKQGTCVRWQLQHCSSSVSSLSIQFTENGGTLQCSLLLCPRLCSCDHETYGSWDVSSPCWYLSGAWLVGRSFISSQYQKFCS